MNKKGITLSVIIGMVIAIGLMIPMCKLGADLFRVSAQAGDNFAEFVKELNDFGESGKDKEKRYFTLIIDDRTSVYIFNSDSTIITRNIIDPPIGDEISSVYFHKPSACPEGKACACLCEQISPKIIDVGRLLAHALNIELTCPKVYCSDLKVGVKEINSRASELGEQAFKSSYSGSGYEIMEGSFPSGAGFKNEPDNYYIKGGYVFERHPETNPYGILWGKWNDRRRFLTLTKENDQISISVQQT